MILLFISAAFGEAYNLQILEAGTGAILTDIEVQIGEEVVFSNSEGIVLFETEDGEFTVSINSADHNTVVLTNKAFKKNYQQVWLHPSLTPPEIVVEAKREDPHTVSQTLDREKVERTPGTHDDPIRLLQSLSSVSKTREYGPNSGDIVLRAAQPSHNRLFLDGVEIPYLYHFQQYASVIHTRMLDTVSVYPSAYGASYGDAAGGIVNVQTRYMDRQIPNGASNINFIMAGGAANQPIGSGVLSLSGRRSHADLYDSGSDQYTEWPVFWDYMTRYSFKTSQGFRLSLTAIGARDKYGRRLFDNETLDPVGQEENPDFTYDRMFHSFIMRGDVRLSDWRSDTVVSIVNDDWKGELAEASQRRNDLYLWGRHQSTWLATSNINISAGADARVGTVKREVNTTQVYPTLPDEAPLLAQGISLSDALAERRFGVWFEPVLSLRDLSFQPGLRYLSVPNSNLNALDPRMTLRFNRPQWGLRAGTGRYSQSPSVDELSQKDLLMTESFHGAFGVDLTILERLEMSFDLWGRDTTNSIIQIPGKDLTQLDTRAFGGEWGFKYRLKERFFAWLSVSSANSRMEEKTWAYDQPYAMDLVFSWRFHPKWDFGMRYRYAAGLPYIPPSSSLYQANSDSFEPQYELVYSERMPDYQKIDLHLAHRRWIGSMTMTTYMELWYVPPSANTLYPIYNYDYSQSQLVVGPPFVPLLGIRLEN